MPIGEPSVLQSVVSFLERQKLEFFIEEEQYCDKITVKSGATTAYVSVYNSGKIVLGGRDSPLKALLAEMKSAIETGGAIPGQVLPFEIDKFPQTIRERVPDCDPVIVRFIEESIRCIRSDALLAAAFMMGAASERAINLLIHTYGDSIRGDSAREQFLSRVGGRFISRKYEEFMRSYQSCKNKPTDSLSQDLDVIIGSMFQFCRVTRNEIGHPQIVPDLDRGVVLANLGQFVTYIERIYQLIRYFKENGVVV